MALVLRGAHWELETAAHHVTAGRLTREDWQELLTKLDYLRSLVAQRAGDTNGPAIGHVGRPFNVSESE